MSRFAFAAALGVGILSSSAAEASWPCGEGCGYAAYAMVTGGGIATSAAMQVMLLQGEPVEDGWRIGAGSLAGINMVAGGAFFIAAGIVDEDDAPLLVVLGALHTAIAVSNGFTLLVNATAGEEPVDAPNEGVQAGTSVAFQF
jgi:hypothetical protein